MPQGVMTLSLVRQRVCLSRPRNIQRNLIVTSSTPLAHTRRLKQTVGAIAQATQLLILSANAESLIPHTVYPGRRK